jgi:hypothetical protein
MGLNNFRTTRGVAGFTDLDATNINVDTLDALELIDGSARKRPTAQLQSRSALSASTNAESVVYQRAPVNDEATQGTESVLTLLQSGIDPAVVMRRELDGQGGAYRQRLDAALGRFARLNANLSFEFDTLSDVPNYKTFTTGGGNFSFSLTDRPRRIQLTHDGSASSDEFGTVKSTVLTTSESLGAFRITFKNLSATANDSRNVPRVGITSALGNSNIRQASGVSLFVKLTGNSSFSGFDNGSQVFADSTFSVGLSGDIDVSIEYDGSQAKLLIDGELISQTAFSRNADFVPVFQVRDESNNSSGETVEVGQITVESISGTF